MSLNIPLGCNTKWVETFNEFVNQIIDCARIGIIKLWFNFSLEFKFAGKGHKHLLEKKTRNTNNLQKWKLRDQVNKEPVIYSRLCDLWWWIMGPHDLCDYWFVNLLIYIYLYIGFLSSSVMVCCVSTVFLCNLNSSIWWGIFCVLLNFFFS